VNKKDIINNVNKDNIIINDSALVMHGIIEECKDVESIDPKSFSGEVKIIDGYKVMSLEDILEYKKSLNSSKEKKMITKLDLLLGSNDNYRYERKLNSEGYKLIGGVDEVGRGPLVGPVVAACVILPVGYKLEGLTDSKKLSEKKREEFYDIIMRDAIAVGVGEISAKVIDEVNIYEASKLAMLEAIKSLKVKPDYLLIDAMKLDIDIKQTSIIKGDFLSQSIAAASVIAKVTRDRMMVELDKKYPEYEFAKHKGYPTKRHVELIEKYGVLENYRFTYRPVCDLILKEKE